MPDDAEQVYEELRAIQEEAGAGNRTEAAFERARALIEHRDNDCRWQALIAVAEWIRTDPELVWDVVTTYGESDDEDMRAGVGCVLLEHLLEHHFDVYFPKLRSELRDGATRLADTFSMCWRFGQSEAQWEKVEQLRRELGIPPSLESWGKEPG